MNTRLRSIYEADPDYCYHCGVKITPEDTGKYEVRGHDSSPYSYHIGWSCTKCFKEVSE